MRIMVHHTYYSEKTHLGRKRGSQYKYLYIRPEDHKRVRNVEKYARKAFSLGTIPVLYAIESLQDEHLQEDLAHQAEGRTAYYYVTRHNDPEPQGQPRNGWPKLITFLRSIGVENAEVSGLNFRINPDPRLLPNELAKTKKVRPAECVGAVASKLIRAGIAARIRSVCAPYNSKDIRTQLQNGRTIEW